MGSQRCAGGPGWRASRGQTTLPPETRSAEDWAREARGSGRAAVTAVPHSQPACWGSGLISLLPLLSNCGLFRGTPPHTLLFRSSAENRRPLILRLLATVCDDDPLSRGIFRRSPCLCMLYSHSLTHDTRAFLQNSPARTHACSISVLNVKPASAPESPHPPGKDGAIPAGTA